MNYLPLLHGGHAFTWQAWHPEPTLIAGSVLALGLYAWRFEALAPARRPSLIRVGSFVLGVAFVFIALGSPLDVGAERLFALHMLQHVVLYAWAAPLIWLGLTRPMFEPVLLVPALRNVLSVIFHPLLAASVFTVNMWFWHLPPVYEVAVTETAVHYTMHISFLATGLMFWWTLAGPRELLHVVRPGWRLLYILLSSIPMMILAFSLVGTPSVLYDYYAAQPRLWGISPLLDQQLGGIVMGSLGEVVEFIPFSAIFFRLTEEEEDSDDQLPPLDELVSMQVDSIRDNGHVRPGIQSK